MNYQDRVNKNTHTIKTNYKFGLCYRNVEGIDLDVYYKHKGIMGAADE